MNQEQELFNKPPEEILLAAVRIEDMLLQCLENYILYSLGIVSKTFENMNSLNDFRQYKYEIELAIEKGVLSFDDLRHDALLLLRNSC